MAVNQLSRVGYRTILGVHHTTDILRLLGTRITSVVREFVLDRCHSTLGGVRERSDHANTTLWRQGLTYLQTVFKDGPSVWFLRLLTNWVRHCVLFICSVVSWFPQVLQLPLVLRRVLHLIIAHGVVCILTHILGPLVPGTPHLFIWNEAVAFALSFTHKLLLGMLKILDITHIITIILLLRVILTNSINSLTLWLVDPLSTSFPCKLSSKRIRFEIKLTHSSPYVGWGWHSQTNPAVPRTSENLS